MHGYDLKWDVRFRQISTGFGVFFNDVCGNMNIDVYAHRVTYVLELHVDNYVQRAIFE